MTSARNPKNFRLFIPFPEVMDSFPPTAILAERSILKAGNF